MTDSAKRCNHCYRLGHIERDCPERAQSIAFGNRREFDALYGDRKIGRKERGDKTEATLAIGPEYAMVFESKAKHPQASTDGGAIDWSRVAAGHRIDAEKASEDPMANYKRR